MILFFLVPNLAGLHWGFFLQQIKNICNVLMLDDMHASLSDLKYSPPSSMLHRHRVPLFAFQSLVCSSDALAHSCDSYHSDVSAVPLLGCPRRLLLSLFIKLDSAPKCGVVRFIMKIFLSWILLRIILWLVVCIMPIPIKMVNQSWTCFQLAVKGSSL